MTTVIPAAPGWYLEETDEQGDVTLDPVIAWKVATTQDGEDVLLPFVDGGPGFPPFAHTEESLKSFSRRVTYRPTHDPTTSPTT
jgi:hypothetical protein